MNKLIYFDPVDGKTIDNQVVDKNDKNICIIEKRNNGIFSVKASNEAFAYSAKDYILQTYQSEVNKIFVNVKNNFYQYEKTIYGDLELYDPKENKLEKLKNKFEKNKEKYDYLLNKVKLKDNVKALKANYVRNQKFVNNSVKDYLNKKNEEISTEYNDDEEVKENFSKIDEINRELMPISEEDIKNVIIEDGDDKELSDEEMEARITKLRKRQGMGNYIIFAQSVIPTAEAKPSHMMFDEIQKNYDKIKKKYQNNDDIVQSVNIQKAFLNNIITNKGNQNIKGSELFSNELSVYFPEIITPFAVLNPKQQCVHFEKGSLGEIERMFKLSGNDYMNVALINYPTSTKNKLTDSSIFFKIGDNYYRMKLSTKAGRKGIGAHASVTGLNEYIFKKDPAVDPKIFATTNSNIDVTKYINYFTLPVKLLLAHNRYIEEIKLLSTFSLTSSAYYIDVANILVKKYNLYDKMNALLKRYNGNEDIASIKAVEWYMNNELNFTGLIMYILKYASYDFAQVNVKQVSSIGETKQISGNLLLEDNKQFLKTEWHYEYTIQYPAIFSGNINMSFDIEKGKPQKLNFHILGNETSFS